MATDGDRPVVGIPIGDPAGVGAEVAVRAAVAVDGCVPVLVGDADVIESALDHSGVDSVLDVRSGLGDGELPPPATGGLVVLDLNNVTEFSYGVVREEYGQASIEYLRRGLDLILEGTFDAITAAPVHDAAVRRAIGSSQLAFVEEYLDLDTWTIVLVGDALRVSHVSIHLSLREALDLVTTDRVADTIGITDAWLRKLGVDDPRIAVAGLNPHAGEEGMLGDEEDTEIRPAIERASNEGIDAEGPLSPDTVFASTAGGEYDCVVTMYHDQGHIPFKTLEFQGAEFAGAAVLAGYPFPYTSPNHGPAFDIAGDGRASSESMRNALALATRMASRSTAGQ